MKTNLVLLTLLLLTACAAPVPQPTAQPSLTQASPPAPAATLTTTRPAETPTPGPSHAPTATTRPTEEPNRNAPARATGAPLERLPGGQAVTITGLRMVDANNGWAMERAGHILRTGDGGVTWQDVSPPEEGFRLGYAFDANNAWAVPAGGHIIMKDPSGSEVAQAHETAITWRTADGGQTWQPSQPFSLERVSSGQVMGKPITFSASLQMFDPREGDGWLFLTVDCDTHMGCGWQIYNTADSGGAWHRVTTSDETFTAPPLLSVVFTNRRDGWGAGSFLGFGGAAGPPFSTIYQTLDRGMHWQPVPLPEPPHLPEAFRDAQRDCGARSIFRNGHALIVWTECMLNTGDYPRYSFYHLSTDGGGTWTSGPIGHLAYQMIDFIDAQTGWRIAANASGGNDLQQTKDGGVTWTTLRHVIWDGDVDFLNAADGYILAHYEDSIALLVTHDGGRTFREIKPVVEN